MTVCAAGVLEAIAEHARREAPRECCGLLIGRNDRVDAVIRTRNHAADPTRRYEIDPRDIFEAIRRCRGTAQDVIGAYHSHPRTEAQPSESDLAEAVGGFLYLIAGPVARELPLQIRGYRLMDGNFRAVRLVPAPEEPET